MKKLIYNTNVHDGPRDEMDYTTYRRIPLVKGLTNNIISSFRDFPHIKMVKYNTLKISHLYSQIKDKTPTLFKSDVIYEIPCDGCQKTYIGQTSQWLKQRLSLHKSDCRTHKKRCALVDHHLETGHTFTIDKVKVLKQESNYKSRLFMEMCFINKNKESINFKSDTNQLNTIYCNLLKH